MWAIRSLTRIERNSACAPNLSPVVPKTLSPIVNSLTALPLEETAQVAASATANGDGRGLLGKREADVARLVAEGLSNKQIGARLFISERTVDSHVRNILNKLGFNSRAQIAGWMASHAAEPRSRT